MRLHLILRLDRHQGLQSQWSIECVPEQLALRITLSPTMEQGGEEPLWSGDGREMFYRHVASWFSVTIRATPQDVQTEAPKLLFDGPFRNPPGLSHAYDDSNGQQRFLLLQSRGIEANKISLLTNAFEVIRLALAREP